MAKSKEPKKVSMELEYWEITQLNEIQDSREALAELQRAIMPFAEAISKKQRVWWDRVLESRGLTRDGTNYVVANGRTIENQGATQ